jgi:heme-degrading monooxygenase HmoA
MPFISLTRIRSIRFLPLFLLHSWRSIRQVKRAPGFQTGALLPDKDWTFWTMTAWDSQESMRQFMLSGSRKAAMPHLIEWCDEAAVAHWTEPDPALSSQTPDPRPQTPSWSEADRRMRSSGRPSKIKHPSPNHAILSYKAPRTTRITKITRASS